jgi:hypothetical protein
MMTAAKKSEVKPQATPQPQPTVAVVAVPPSRQEAKLEQLKAAWLARGVDLSKMTITPDGKNLMINVGESWPAVEVRVAGGIDLPTIRSYQMNSFEAAVKADELLAKQRGLDAKKTAPAIPKAAAQPEQPKAETPAERKAAAHQAIEEKLDAQA